MCWWKGTGISIQQAHSLFRTGGWLCHNPTGFLKQNAIGYIVYKPQKFSQGSLVWKSETRAWADFRKGASFFLVCWRCLLAMLPHGRGAETGFSWLFFFVWMMIVFPRYQPSWSNYLQTPWLSHWSFKQMDVEGRSTCRPEHHANQTPSHLLEWKMNKMIIWITRMYYIPKQCSHSVWSQLNWCFWFPPHSSFYGNVWTQHGSFHSFNFALPTSGFWSFRKIDWVLPEPLCLWPPDSV